MADFWIVSDRVYKHHATPDIAMAELSRLQLKYGVEKNFRLYRCKTSLKQTGAYHRLEVIAREFLDLTEYQLQLRGLDSDNRQSLAERAERIRAALGPSQPTEGEQKP